MKNIIDCPKCKSNKVKEIIYGLMYEYKKGEIYAGCEIFPGVSPKWHCVNCKHEWGVFDDNI